MAAYWKASTGLGIAALCLTLWSGRAAGQTRSNEAGHRGRGSDGQHDFDFTIGTWKLHFSRLQHPLSGSTTWIDFTGTVVARKVWDGRGDLEEIEADGPTGHIEGMTLRLYNPQSHQWNLYWANGRDGVLNPPVIGEFRNGSGAFYDQEQFEGRAILVRNVYSDIAPDSYRFEQAYSADGGRTWEANLKAVVTREKQDSTHADATPTDTARGYHDFDWQLGSWTIHMSRLQHPLTRSTTWTGLDGTVVVRKIWGGRANLAEIETRGPSGHLQFLSLRLYNPQARQWSLNFASSNSGVMSVPMVGEFKNRRGDFYDQEAFNGRTILVRFSFLNIHDEQAFSDDGGKTWEVNWINQHTRAGHQRDKGQ